MAEEDTYTIIEEYPDGHEMSREHHGPLTEEQIRTGADDTWDKTLEFWRRMDEGLNHWSVEERLDELFQVGVLYVEDGYSYRLEPVRDHVIVVTWSEPEDGTAVYGPYAPGEIDNALPQIGPYFHNDGVLPSDVTFDVRKLDKP